MLFKCRFATNIWNDFNNIMDLNVNLESVILGTGLCNVYNHVISLITYMIYKEWLKESYENIMRPKNSCIKMFLSDLEYKANVYKHTKWTNVNIVINEIISSIKGT